MKTASIILVLAILLTGLMAGIFFTWSNAVKPGIGKLSDIEYLKALQSMNRVILNNTFKFIFAGSIFCVLLVPLFYLNLYPKNIFWLLALISLIYLVGVFIITIKGNIPLNEILDKTNLESISIQEVANLRTSIESKWNSLNLIRCISSAITFLLLTISFVFLNK